MLKVDNIKFFTDNFSKYVEVEMLPVNPTSFHCIQHLKPSELWLDSVFSEKLRSDGDPLYTCNEFKKFLDDYDIAHTMSSAGYAQSNGCCACV